MAETLSFDCKQAPALYAEPMTMVYEGEESGTLAVKAPFGEVSLPATKSEREGVDENGEKITATGIQAFGPANVLMPDKAAIEACVAGKLNAEQAADDDIVYSTALHCQVEVPVGKEPVPINLGVELALLDPATAQLSITRTYVEPTTLKGGVLKLDAFSSCDVAR